MKLIFEGCIVIVVIQHTLETALKAQRISPYFICSTHSLIECTVYESGLFILCVVKK